MASLALIVVASMSTLNVALLAALLVALARIRADLRADLGALAAAVAALTPPCPAAAAAPARGKRAHRDRRVH